MGSLQTQKMAAGPMFQKKKKCRFTEELGPEAWSHFSDVPFSCLYTPFAFTSYFSLYQKADWALHFGAILGDLQGCVWLASISAFSNQAPVGT